MKISVSKATQKAIARSAHRSNLEDEIERLRAVIVRIDAINDNPASFSEEINDLCGKILRPHLYQQEKQT